MLDDHDKKIRMQEANKVLSIRGKLPSTAPFDSDLVDSRNDKHSWQVGKSHDTAPTALVFHLPMLDLNTNSYNKIVDLNSCHQ